MVEILGKRLELLEEIKKYWIKSRCLRFGRAESVLKGTKSNYPPTQPQKQANVLSSFLSTITHPVDKTLIISLQLRNVIPGHEIQMEK